MKWTQQHSQNAVAARERQRIARATAEPARELRRRVPVPRKLRAIVTIQIRDREVGDSLTLNLHRTPWADHWVCEQGEYSTAQLCAAFRHMLHSAAVRDEPRNTRNTRK